MTERLLVRARAGDDQAFRELVEPYRRELQLHCYRILGCYLAEPGERVAHPAGLMVLTPGVDRIHGMTRFFDNDLLRRFGLPETWAER